MRPHRRQPTRLCHPWDSPGKNTGVGCHFLLQCMKMKSESEVAQSCPTLCDPMDCSLPGFSVHGIFQARILEWVANFLLLGIFSTQGLNLGLLHCRQILYCLSHQGNPKYLALKVYSFIYVAIHLVSKYLLNTFYRQRTVLGLGNPV